MASCDGRTVADDEAVSGVTPAQVTAAFQGTHVATLSWITSDPLPDDELTLELHARSEGATLDCYGGRLSISVNVILTTRDHGELERFDATLHADTGQLARAEIYRIGSRVALDADLAVVDGEVRVSGMLTTADDTLPADRAIFPAPEDGAGGGGG